MATFATDTTIGSTATDAAFATGTRIWAGGVTTPATSVNFVASANHTNGTVVRFPADGNTYWTRNATAYAGGTPPVEFDAQYFGDPVTTYLPTEAFHATAGTTVTANDSTIACSHLGNSSSSGIVGTFDFRDVVIYANNPPLVNGDQTQTSSSHNWNFNNVTYIDNTLVGTANLGKYFAPLNNTTDYQIDGLNVYGNVSPTDSTLGFLIFFPSFNGITSGSTLNNISLWNGETGADILGGALTYAYSVFSGLRSGPLGFRPFYDPSSATRALFRCGFGGDNQLNQHGHLLSYDFRAIEGLTGQWRFALDFAGRTTIVNPLVGTLASGRLAWACGSTSNNSGFRSYIGHVPVITGDAIFANAGILPMVTFPATWNDTTLPTEGGDILKQTDGAVSPVANGLGFETESGTLSTGGLASYSSTSTSNTSSRIGYTYPTEQNYRVYSWQQQGWGTQIPITPTVTGATDAQVAADRASGVYPATTADGFTTSRSISFASDPLIANADITPVEAQTQRSPVVGSIPSRDTNEIGAYSKVVSWNAAETNGSHTALVPLIHTLTGTTLSFGSQNLSIGTRSTIQPNSNSVTGTAFDIRASDITIGVDAGGIAVADVISTNGTVSLEDYGTGTATNKATIAAGTTSGGNMVVTHTTDATMRNLTLTGGGTFLATGETFDGCDLDFDIIDGSNTTHSNSTIAVGTTYRDIQSDTNTNVTYTGTFDAQISGANNTAYSIEDLLGTGFNTSGATITFIPGGNTGLSIQATSAELTAANVIVDPSITVVAPPLVRNFTFAKAGKYTLGRVRGGTYTAISTAETAVTTSSTLTITTGTDGWLVGDTIRMRYLPTNGTSGNTSLYVPVPINTALTDGTTAIDHSAVVVEILASVDISDALVSGATISNRTISGTNIPFVVRTTGDLNLPQTKGLYFELFQHSGTLLHMNTNNFDAADMFSIGALGITHNEVNSSIAKPTIDSQRAVTGISSVGANALIAATDAAATNTYVIATTSGTRDFIVNVVPAGITEGQVEAAVGRRIADAGIIENQEKLATDIQAASIGAASDGTVPNQS